MGRLDGRVAIVTGAGRGLGRAHALLLAAEGASVVVNDLGADVHGQGADATPAQQVVAEIAAAGGRGVVSGHDVADWNQAQALIRTAVDAFGDLHILVNNAGILRDRTLVNMTEDEWDAVLRVHLKGHAVPTRHAVAYWREQSKNGHQVKASVIHTSSLSGLIGNFGQANYASAKLAVLALSRVVALEAARYGVRSNAVSPSARTRLSLSTPGAQESLKPAAEGEFDPLDPANVSPLIVWLAQADCPATSQVFHVHGNQIFVMSMPSIVHRLKTRGRWTLDALDRELPGRLVRPLDLQDFSIRAINGSGDAL
ncbi:MAG: SDR family NAD(P)-dependent oxidoreductase [Armatimonadota bacterium]